MHFKFLPESIPSGKRLFDLFITIPGLIVLTPLCLLIAASILLLDGPPVFFIQERPGHRGRPFRMFKFRTMLIANGKVSPRKDAFRTTKLGRWLRATSLDELPELLNVFKGDMSLVGPRPLLMEYLERYAPEQARRHDVLPGITGWAQVHGRNILGWDEKFTLDVWYVDHWSFWLDLRILWLTVVKVLRREGINQSDTTTMTEFKGRSTR